jgi:hypothetical protein
MSFRTEQETQEFLDSKSLAYRNALLDCVLNCTCVYCQSIREGMLGSTKPATSNEARKRLINGKK